MSVESQINLRTKDLFKHAIKTKEFIAYFQRKLKNELTSKG